MLIRLTIANVLCFNEEITFSMVASDDQKHQSHILSPSAGSKPALLKCSAVYGANGHGKTRFVDAIHALQELICDGVRSDEAIETNYFKLDPNGPARGSRYVVEFRVDNIDYEYGIHFEASRIREEWLYVTRSSRASEKIFTRETAEDSTCTMSYGKGLLSSESPNKNHKTSVYLDVLATSMDSKQPFLKEAVERKVAYLAPAFNWFRDTLTPIAAESFYVSLHQRMQRDKTFNEALSHFLSSADVGISQIAVRETELNEIDKIEMSDELRLRLKKLQDRERLTFGNEDGSTMMIGKDGDRVFMSEIETCRTSIDGDEVKFDIAEESSGTRRLVDLFPMLTNYGDKRRVYIVDELDRKLHPLLARHLLSEFLNSSENQLIYTTHNTHLLDLNLLRRDEVWFIQKRPDGSSSMYSLADMRIHHDLDVRKGYLNGRFGAIPFLGNLTELGWPKEEPSSKLGENT